MSKKNAPWAKLFLAGLMIASEMGCRRPPCLESGPFSASTRDCRPSVAIEPRSAVVNIQMNLPEDFKRLLTKSAIEQNDPKVREALLSYSFRTWSGSGVVIAKMPNMRFPGTLLVTNRHVVDATDVGQIKFSDIGTIEGKVLYVDPLEDLAVFWLDKELAGLKLTDSVVSPGLPVKALGFPALGGNVNFQDTQGYISNVCVMANSIDPDDGPYCYLQHTAPINPGSSGGPLLNSLSDIVGINAAGMIGMNQAFFAVPSGSVARALNASIQILMNRKNEAWMTQQLLDACYGFISELNSPTSRSDVLLPAISPEFLVRNGGLFVRVAREYDPQIDARVVADPYEGMRQVSIWGLSKLSRSVWRLNPSQCNNKNPADNAAEDGRNVRISMTKSDGNNIQLSWKFQRGRWVLVDFN